MTKTSVATVLLVGTILAGLALAQPKQDDKTVPQNEPSKIFIGQPLKNATAALAERNIEFGEGGFAFAQGDPDLSNLIFKLDENHTLVCAYFSRSKQTITSLSMVFFPSRAAHGKANESWVSATELILHPDTSYTVHFSKPRRLERLQPVDE